MNVFYNIKPITMINFLLNCFLGRLNSQENKLNRELLINHVNHLFIIQTFLYFTTYRTKISMHLLTNVYG